MAMPLHNSQIPARKGLLLVMVVFVTFLALYQFWAFSVSTHLSALPSGEKYSVVEASSYGISSMNFDPIPSDSIEEATRSIYDNVHANKVEVENGLPSGDALSMRRFWGKESSIEERGKVGVGDGAARDGWHGARSIPIMPGNTSGPAITQQALKMKHGNKNTRTVPILGSSSQNDSARIKRYITKIRGPTVTLSEMNFMLFKSHFASSLVRPRLSLLRDRELMSVKLRINNASGMKNVGELYAPLFRNVSMFIRSYNLMERMLKIYIYKEGEKPIFHQPRLRGLYALEGWFMKLLQRSKRFVVRDPRRAHLFYLPFSSEILRMRLYDEKSHGIKNLENYLTDYLGLLKKKYLFWNRTKGEDHFFVGCHDWAPRITRNHLSSCIRALCNANVAMGFSIGKDVSVPVTYIHSGSDPSRDLGGKPASERQILAFFAGSMHGYLRPILLQHWQNKSQDMQIFGPMQRDVEGKAVYRNYMKSSKYCICVRGYGVHSPRVVESIYYECVPVIISDNYVPPFFEALDWESFAVFVLEKDVPNLRNILVSIPEKQYLEMQFRVKMVQRHFLWHKDPEKFDLFHMILHSIWYNRVFEIPSK